MNNEELIDVKTLRPFRRFIYTIGALPSSYLMSMTYEEQLIWLCNYLSQTVIPALNNNGLAVEELQAKYVELKDYVDNYFDDLDIQEEIDNKLDEMALDGTLENLIGQYIELMTTYTYNSVAEMKAATNLVNGSFARTSGFYSYDDKGGAYYKIRTITNQDTIDNMTLFAITSDDTLVAELIVNDDLNLNQLGAKDEANFDCTTMFQKAFTLGNKVRLLTGKYRITNTLSIPAGFTIEGVENQYNSSEICLTASATSVLSVEDRNITLRNLLISKDGDFTCYGINAVAYNNNHYNLTIEKCRLTGFTTGIRLSGSIWWESSIIDTRVSLCDVGFSIVNTFDFYFKQFYTDRCSKAMGLYGTNTISFYNCNFGVVSEGIDVAFGSDGQKMNLSFIGCNFEYDAELETAVGGFINVANNRASSCNISMINNRFTINGQNANVKSMAFNRYTTIEFINNMYLPNSETDNPTSFFNVSYPPKLEFGALKFLGGNTTMPRPSYTGANKPTIQDLENGGIPACDAGTPDLSSYTPANGQMVYVTINNSVYIYINGSWKKLTIANL